MFGRRSDLLPGWRTVRRAVPVAAGAPVAAAMGPDPDRVLVLGAAAAAGLGVATHADGLPGRLAAGLASRTRRGAAVEAVGRPGASLADIAALTPFERLPRFDAVVLSVGMAEALHGTAMTAWRSELADLLARIVAAAGVGLRLVVTTLPPPSHISPLVGRDASQADRRARAVNRVIEAVADAQDSALVVRLDEHAAPVASPNASTYQMWAEQIAGGLAPLLDAGLATAPGHVARSVPDPEQRRLAALTRTGLTEDTVDRFEDLALRARDLLGGEAAAVGFIDADSHWFVATGDTRTGSVPRAISPCDQTIGSSSGVLVGDLALDPRFSSNPMVTGDPRLRFYAGYPIESLDGYRIGSICVLSSTPRDPATIDLGALQRLAHEARLRL